MENSQSFPGHYPEDSAEMSAQPEMPVDSFKDRLAELLEDYMTPGAAADLTPKIVALAQECAGIEPQKDSHSIIWRLCDIFRRHENGPLVASCLMLLIGREEKSEVEIAKSLGITKAAVSAVKTSLQDVLGIESRCGRSNKARKHFAAITLARGKRKRENTWTDRQHWSAAFARR